MIQGPLQTPLSLSLSLSSLSLQEKMCGGGLTEMQQSRRTPRFHEEMKQTFPHAASPAASCFSPRPHPPAPPPAGLAIVAALEAELAQSHTSTSCTKAAESAAPASPTSSLPIPIISSSSTAYDHHDHEVQYMIISKDEFPAYFHNQIRDRSVIKHHTAADGGTPKSIFSTSLSPPSCTSYNYIMSCNLYRDQLLHDDFLCSCFSCKRPLAPGKDIYMYRGDRAFCSTECRHKHMVADELSLPCSTIQINQQCVQASSPTTKQPKFTPPVAIAILV